jgi:hypothetical protein
MVCAPGAAQQQGAVENLVNVVKGNFLPGRTFHDEADLEAQCATWLPQVNAGRLSAATGQLPVVLLTAERAAFGPLPPTAHDDGLFDTVLGRQESLVTIATNRYSVPSHLVGQALTARLDPTWIEVYAGTTLVATPAPARPAGAVHHPGARRGRFRPQATGGRAGLARRTPRPRARGRGGRHTGWPQARHREGRADRPALAAGAGVGRGRIWTRVDDARGPAPQQPEPARGRARAGPR